MIQVCIRNLYFQRASNFIVLTVHDFIFKLLTAFVVAAFLAPVLES